uniref:Uncharacterized protein n=1 Tax=Arundo donax TaxID=35708 RepID=A0A0A9AI45_ARUDO
MASPPRRHLRVPSQLRRRPLMASRCRQQCLRRHI